MESAYGTTSATASNATVKKAAEIVCKYCPYPYGEWAYCEYCMVEKIRKGEDEDETDY